jgi:hypothetical protein
MGLLAQILRLSGPTHGRPPCSSLSSPVDLVPIVPNLISSPRELGKHALVLKIHILLFLAKLSSTLILSKVICRVLHSSGQVMDISG